MPGMDGFEVTEQIRQNSSLPYIPIFLVTGYSGTVSTEQLTEIEGFICKPIDFEDLLNQIRATLQIVI